MSPKRVEVAIGVLTRRDDTGWHVLITRRPDHAVLGGYWEFPGGKREPLESMEECLRREFLEEVGVQIEVTEPLKIIEHEYAHATVLLHPYLCRKIAGEPTDISVAEHRWVRPIELPRFSFPEANGELIAEIVERFEGMP